MDELDQSEEVLRAKRASQNSPWISIQQISQTYGISIRTLRRMEAEGLMPPRTKRGKYWMYSKAEIAQIIPIGRRNLRRSRDQGLL
jgi:DNA-binding transcriptional MerR regulator